MTPLSIPPLFAFGAHSGASRDPEKESSAKTGLDTFTKVVLGLGAVGFTVGLPVLLGYMWRSQKTPSTQTAQGIRPLLAPQPTPQAAGVYKPGFEEFESQGDVELERGEVAVAVHSYMEALGDLFLKIENLEWKRESEQPMPHAEDVARLRQKLAEQVEVVFKTGVGNDYDLGLALLNLGPNTGKQVVAELLRDAAASLDKTRRLTDVLGAAGVFIVDVPDADPSLGRPFHADFIYSLNHYAELLAAGMNRDTATPQDYAKLAEVYQEMWESDKEAGSNDQWARLKEAASYYYNAIRAAVHLWQDPTDYIEPLTRVLVAIEKLGPEFRTRGPGDVRSWVLRLLPDETPRSTVEAWARIAEENLALGATTVNVAFDAATQWFLLGEIGNAAAAFRTIVRNTPAEVAFDPVWRVGQFAVSPVAAALATFKVRLDSEIERWEGVHPETGFDLMQRHLAELLDAVIRTVAPDTSGRTLVEQMDSWTRYSAALTEVMASPDAQLAMDEAVLFLQAERLKAFDPVEIRKALKGESVAMDLALALNDAIPLALRPRWKGYAEGKDVERRAAEKQAKDRDRLDKDAEWKSSKIPVGAPSIL